MDLYAEYGKAAVAAGYFEKNLVLLLAFERSRDKSDDEFAKQYQNFSKLPLGPLIREAQKHIDLAPGSGDILEQILRHRNCLIHTLGTQIWLYVYKGEEAEKQLVHNLRELECFFHGAAELIFEGIKQSGAARGLPVEALERAVQGAFGTYKLIPEFARGEEEKKGLY